MITGTVSSHPLEVGRVVINASVSGLVTGCLVGFTLMYGGKVWIWIKGSKQEVSQVMGHIGTEAYCRQLSVALSVGFVGLQILIMIRDGGVLQKTSLSLLKALGLYSVFCLTAIVGSLAGKQVTDRNYPTFVKPIIFLGVASIVCQLYQKYRS